MNSRRLIAAAVLSVALAAPAWADLDEAKDMLRQGDSEAALEQLETLANGGDTDAMVFLGDMHHEGNGVAANFSLAWSWYNRASRQSNPEAQYKLGRMLWRGDGTPQNEVEALELFELAAKSGHEQAQLEAGLIYRDGTRRTRKSPTKALEYLTAAAAQGNAEAELALEELAEQGVAPNEQVERPKDVEQPQADQAVLDMDEPERIRAAITAWIDSINSNFEGSSPRPEVIVSEVDGKFEVQIPDLVFSTGATDSVRFGLVELSLTPFGDAPGDSSEDWMATRRYRLEMTPPTRIELQNGLEIYAITYEASDITGVWLPAFYNFVETNVELRNLALTDAAGQTLVKADHSSWLANLQETEPGIWSGPYGMEISNIVVTPPEGGMMTIGRISTETALDGVRAEPYGRMVNQMNTDPEAFITELMDPADGGAAISEMIKLVASSSFDMAIEDLIYVSPEGKEEFALAALGFGGIASQEGADNSKISISYEHSGLNAPLEGPEAELVPTNTQLVLAVDRIPLESLARGMVEMLGLAMVEAARADSGAAMTDDFSEVELQGRVLSIVSAAQTGMTVDLSMESALSSLDLSGGVEANAEALFGLTGAFDLTVSEIDGVLAMIDQDPMLAIYKDVFAAFAGTAIREQGPSDGETSKFAIVIQPDGNLLVNGENAFAIMAGAMAPDQEGQMMPDQESQEN